jgi:hypothetical protein
MPTVKTYTIIENVHGSSSRQHRLVRAAWKKGLTEIKIFHYLKQSGIFLRGWYLQADQFKLRCIGYDLNESEARINKIDSDTTTKS